MGGEDDAQEALLDKLRSGEYSEVVKTATSAAEAQLCLQADGNVVKSNPYTAFAPGGVARPPQTAADAAGDDDDELRRLRQARLAQLKDEQFLRWQGHGVLRELADEREFIEAIKPHKRAVVLLGEGSIATARGAASDVHEALQRLSQKHLEAQFCWLSSERAFFLTRMVELEGLPAIFVLHDGMVVDHLPPSRLFARSSASSPLFARHLASALHSAGALLNSSAGSSSEEEEDEDDQTRRRRGR